VGRFVMALVILSNPTKLQKDCPLRKCNARVGRNIDGVGILLRLRLRLNG
jgi:hypothetical protein